MAELREVARGIRFPEGPVALPDGSVLVVDEAGMVATRQLAALIEAVDRAAGKLVLVGDHRQLPELKAGGAFRGLVRRGLAIELTENRRQVHAWERGALAQLRDGDPDDALAAYNAHRRLVFARPGEDVRDQMVSEWWASQNLDGALMIAYRRSRRHRPQRSSARAHAP